MKRKSQKVPSRSHCPIFFGLELFGDAWTLLIVRDMMFKGKSSYRDFLESDERISTNILADRLLRLEKAGIVKKSTLHTAEARTAYTLTDKGIALMPILIEIVVWSATYDSQTAAPPEFVQEAKTKRAALITRIARQLRGAGAK